ncbi:MAG: EamA family transporter [Candidatus Aenigmatarchaeota archaeon]
MDWYYFALLSLGMYSVQGLLLKYAAMKNCDRNLTTIYYMLTVSVISFLMILFYGISTITIIGLVAAVINGVFFSLHTTSVIESLKKISASMFFPIMSLNNAVLVILLILFLGEKVTLQNFIGIIIAIISLYFLRQSDKNEKRA